MAVRPQVHTVGVKCIRKVWYFDNTREKSVEFVPVWDLCPGIGLLLPVRQSSKQNAFCYHLICPSLLVNYSRLIIDWWSPSGDWTLRLHNNGQAELVEENTNLALTWLTRDISTKGLLVDTCWHQARIDRLNIFVHPISYFPSKTRRRGTSTSPRERLPGTYCVQLQLHEMGWEEVDIPTSCWALSWCRGIGMRLQTWI